MKLHRYAKAPQFLKVWPTVPVIFEYSRLALQIEVRFHNSGCPISTRYDQKVLGPIYLDSIN